MVKDNRAVLGTDIFSLAIGGGRIMQMPEDLKKFFKRANFGIKGNLDSLSMAACAGADLFVGGIIYGTASIAWNNRTDPF